MRQLSRLDAVTFLRELESGSTRPCVLVCEDPESDAIGEFVIKLRSSVRSGPTGLAFEFIAAHLAELLGIPIPESALVQIDGALGDSLPEGSAATATRIKNSVGLNFGLRYMAPGYNTWPVEESVPDALRQAALEIVAFDALIDNSDRNTAKPNVLWKGAELFVIEHELSFAFLFLVGGVPQAWIDRLSFLKKHPFYPGLRGRDDLDLTRFLAALTRPPTTRSMPSSTPCHPSSRQMRTSTRSALTSAPPEMTANRSERLSLGYCDEDKDSIHVHGLALHP